jgi:hypothetical protein
MVINFIEFIKNTNEFIRVNHYFMYAIEQSQPSAKTAEESSLGSRSALLFCRLIRVQASLFRPVQVD